MNQLMIAINAVGAGALDEIQMTNFRLDELASTVGPSDSGMRRATPVRQQPVNQTQGNNR
jgi:hypothetical protein